jgi:hypothetical protein
MRAMSFSTPVSTFSLWDSRGIRYFLRFVLLALGIWGGLLVTPLQAADLVINEVMTSNTSAYQDTSAPAAYDDWIELYNDGSGSVALAGKYLTDNNTLTKWQIPADVASLAPGERIIVWCDNATSQNTATSLHASFGLSDGETIRLVDSDGTTVLDSILPPTLSDNTSYGRITDGNDTWNVFDISSPNTSNGSTSSIANLRVIEVSYHTDSPNKDTVEIYNPTSSPVDIAGWYLTDNKNSPKKFKITSGTVPANGYLTIEANVEVAGQYKFGTDSSDPNLFEFSEHGEEVYLFSGDGTNLTGYSNGFAFGAGHNANNTVMGSETGTGSTSIPYITSSADGARQVITLAKKPTLGRANAAPLVGPVVISEIKYNGTGDAEWIELKNITSSAVKLYDPVHPENCWKVSGLEYQFPANTEMPANGVLMLVPNTVEIDTFRSDNGISTAVAILQWGATATLEDLGEKLQIERPGNPEPAPSTFVPYYVIDAVGYSNAAPWPTDASGTGKSLQRITLTSFGDDAANWQSGTSTPGVALSPMESWRATNSLPTDGSGTGAPTADPDGDGIVNLLEYALTDSGTSLDPNVASTVGLPTVTVESSKLKMAFKRNTSATDVKYEIQASTNLTDWTTLATWDDGATEWTELASGASASESPAGTVSVTDSTEIASGTPRFLRLKVTAP